MNICFFASEVASAINKNKYKHTVETLLDIWKRHDRVGYTIACTKTATVQNIDISQSSVIPYLNALSYSLYYKNVNK